MNTGDRQPRRLTFPTRLLGPSLLVVSTLLYLAAVAGTLYTLEQAYYNPAKWDVVQKLMTNGEYYDQALASSMSRAAREYVIWRADGRTEAQVENARQRAQQAMERMVEADGHNHITAITVLDGRTEETLLSVERRERIRTQHDLSNSLLTRDFERTARQSVTREVAGELESLGVIQLHVTTARGVPEIEAVTARYRWLMIGAVVFITLVYWGLLHFVLLPVTRVIGSMQGAEGTGSPIIDDPRSLLERVYNLLARDATLTRFSKELRDLISGSGLSHADPVLEQVPALILRLTGVDGCQIWTFTRRVSTSQWQFERVYTIPGEEDRAEALEKELLRAIAKHDPVHHPEEWSGVVKPSLGGKDRTGACFTDLLRMGSDRFSLLLIAAPPGAPPLSQWKEDFYTRLSTELRFALSSVEDQRRLILQEKSKANISLSRNLGHDLTNIIATSKLDLMSVKTFLSLSPGEVKESPAKAQVFSESLEALLNNTRFLQEIVNLYRSFSYLQKPKFEEAEIADLVRDVVQLYKLSLSRNIDIGTDVPDKLTVARVEPRLLRLALFNLLTNASDAIKQATSADKPAGSIRVRARLRRQGTEVELAVEDTGTGIRDESGKLVKQDAIAEIFRLGYSTKQNQEGEGLGLNWVQTIVREFHGGDIIAYNRKERGACFAIRLPLERKDEPSGGSNGPEAPAPTKEREAEPSHT